MCFTSDFSVCVLSIEKSAVDLLVLIMSRTKIVVTHYKGNVKIESLKKIES